MAGLAEESVSFSSFFLINIGCFGCLGGDGSDSLVTRPRPDPAWETKEEKDGRIGSEDKGVPLPRPWPNPTAGDSAESRFESSESDFPRGEVKSMKELEGEELPRPRPLPEPEEVEKEEEWRRKEVRLVIDVRW